MWEGQSGTSSLTVSSRRVVSKLRELAADPENQKFLVHEPGCLSALLFFLRPSSKLDLLLPALQTLSFLASHPPNRPALIAFPDLLPRLVDLSDHAVPNVAHFASSTLDLLTNYINGAHSPPAASYPTTSFKKNDLVEAAFFVPKHAFEKNSFETFLLEVKGVVSVAVDSEKEKITVYGTLPDLEFDVRNALKSISVEFELWDDHVKTQETFKSSVINPLLPNLSRNFAATAPHLLNPSVSQRNVPLHMLSPAEQIVLGQRNSLVAYGESFQENSSAALELKKKRRAEEQRKKQSSVRRFFSGLGVW